MAVPTTSPERRGYRALIAFGMTDSQILEFTDRLKEMNLEIREIEPAQAVVRPGTEIHNEGTMHKVYQALMAVGLSNAKIIDAVAKMQNSGVLFREPAKNLSVYAEDTSEEKTGWQPHNADYQYKARSIVAKFYNEQAEKQSDPWITIGSVYVVWFCKTLQNWKCLLSTDVPDNMYYEVTYDGDKHQAYLDAYRKVVNVTFQDLPARVQHAAIHGERHD